ncbi:MAG: transglutaminase domain-containing protein [Bacteroidales bacterium]|nr:transglutaminase domain-containing protein [Bacteroidales bacterium]
MDPEKELDEWQKKYPENSMISVARNLEVKIDLVNNHPEISFAEYREMLVLIDNAAFLADSREYFNNHFTLKKLEAYSLVPEQGKYKKIEVGNFTRKAEIDNSVYFDDQYVYNYTFPSVRKGARLITRSLATTDYVYVPVVFVFGGSVPGENMSLTISHPAEVSIVFKLFGTDTAMVDYSRTLKGKQIIHTWKADNPRYYEFDDKAPDFRYVVPHIVVQLAQYNNGSENIAVIGSLKDLHTYNYSHITKISSENASAVSALADSLARDCTTEAEKVRRIFRWVQQHIKYVAIEDGDNGYVPSDASLVLQRRYGDCKGKTNLLVSMMRSQGIKASYAWIGTRARPYKYSVFPSVVNSDHMIAVWWNYETPVILDGTTFSHRMEDIPTFIQGKECLIEKGPNDFVVYTIPVAPPENNAIIDSLILQVRGDTLTGQGIITFYGESKADMLALFTGKDTSKYRDLLQAQLPKASNKHMIRKVSVSDVNNTDAPFVIRYDFVLPDYLTRANGNLYICMNLNRYVQYLMPNPDRWMPLEAAMKADYRLVCKMRVPQGFRIKNIPENSGGDRPFFRFADEYEVNGENIELKSSATVDFQVLSGDQLTSFREMLLQLNRNYSQSISLEKKS